MCRIEHRAAFADLKIRLTPAEQVGKDHSAQVRDRKRTIRPRVGVSIDPDETDGTRMTGCLGDPAPGTERLRLIAADQPDAGAVTIHADARVYAGLIDGAESAQLAIDPARKAYVHVVRGAVHVNGRPLSAGDAALLADESAIALDHGRDAEVLVFDLAA